MTPAILPHDETERLMALRRLQILDTAPEDSFERITTLAAQIFGVPIAVISLVDANRQWFKSCYGLDATQTDRKIAFCAHAILANETLVIPDAHLDPRFVDNPLVTGGPQIRFYAGAVLRDRDGYNLGTLCLIDRRPHTFTNEQHSQLENLAAIAMNQMELRLGAQDFVRMNDELEARVTLRTAELAESNRALQEEIAVALSLGEERRRDEETLRESRQRLSLLVQQTPLAVIEWSLNSRVVAWNPTAEVLFGYSSSEAIGRHAVGLIVPGSAGEHFCEVWTQLLSKGGTRSTDENCTKDGRTITCEWYNTPLINADGDVIGVASLGQDVSERRRAEEDLQKAEAKYRSIFENAVEGIFQTTPDGHFLSANPALADIYGYRSPDALIEQITDITRQLYVETDRRAQFIGLMEQYNVISEFESQVWHRDGSTVWISEDVRAVRNTEGVLLYYEGIVEDITERKGAQIEIQRALAKERELSELKSRFVSMTSHEFRTPLTAILSSTELLECYGQHWPLAKQRKHFQRIQTAVRNMTRLLEDILIIGKVEAGKLEYCPVPIEIRQFCHGLVEELRLNFEGSSVVTSICSAYCFKVNLDEKLLRYTLSNLLSNAIKYSPPGSIVYLKVSCQSGAIEFKVSDQGIGIPPDEIHQVFESFHRATNVGTIPGTGLGLAIVKRSIDQQGGQITVESAVGVGSTFTVTIPVHPVGEDQL